MKNKFTTLLLLNMLLSFRGFAQEKKIFPDNLQKEDSLSIQAIAIYPESVRLNILHACSFPEVLVKMELLQEKTKTGFKAELDNYSKETQLVIWNLARYPGLLNKIAQNGKKSKEELKQIASEYPGEIYNTIIDNGRKEYELIKKTNELQLAADKEFEKLISGYSDDAKTHFRELIKYPEIIKILSDGMRMTVILGDAYKKDPKGVTHVLDSISTEHAKQNAKNLKEWQDGLEKNPEAKKEMEEAAKKFATDEGYKESELIINDPQIVINYVCYPYPYWMGYPSWYSYPYWYPYPYWYDWGFYWTPYGMVYTGFPSSYFTYWYFYHHHHHYYYNHFTDYCLSYHYGHRQSNTEFNHEISNWVRENESSLPANFFNEDVKRPDRIKELGKFSIEYNEISSKNPGLNLSKEEYLQNNSGIYPNLTKEPGGTDKPIDHQKPEYTDPNRQYDPVYKEPSRTQPNVKIPKQPDPVKPRVDPKPKYEHPKINPKIKPGKR